jgi:isopentenyl-diphosphate Delta-isomerase
MDRLRVFVSSTFSDLRLERQYVEEVLNRLNHTALLFPEHSVAGEATNEFLIHLEKCDVLVYVSSRPSPWVERELARAAELGMPIIELTESVSDDDGYPAGPTHYARQRRRSITRFQATFGSLPELRKGIEQGLGAVISRRFSLASSIRPLGDDVYYRCQQDVENAQEAIGIVQRTASLVLGPRLGRRSQEDRFIKALRARILQACESGQPEIIYLFDRQATLAELEAHPDQYPRAPEAVGWLREALPAIVDADNVHVVGVSEGFTPLVLQDTTLNLAANVGRNLWFQQREAGRSASMTLDELRNACQQEDHMASVLEMAEDSMGSHSASLCVRAVDAEGNELELVNKLQAHQGDGLWHLGFSLFIIDRDDRVLLQKRSSDKYHFPGFWANACCSHHLTSNELITTARRRAIQELGISVSPTKIGSFHYEARCPVSRLVEREFDSVLVAQVVTNELAPNPSEVSAVKWLSIDELQKELDQSEHLYAPWLPMAFDILLKSRP